MSVKGLPEGRMPVVIEMRRKPIHSVLIRGLESRTEWVFQCLSVRNQLADHLAEMDRDG